MIAFDGTLLPVQLILFQPTDLTVTIYFKNYMKNKFLDGTVKQFLNNLKKV